MPYNPDPAPATASMRRVVFPRGYRPGVVHACAACATHALSRVAAASASPVDPARFNYGYACDLHYDGCQHPDGFRRYA